jgi:hypothetical protein
MKEIIALAKERADLFGVKNVVALDYRRRQFLSCK